MEDSLKNAFNETFSELPSANGLVTAPGICINKSIHERGFEESQKVSDVNTMGTLWPVNLRANDLVQNNTGSGSIIMIASVAAHGIKVPNQQRAIYAMSEAAGKALARSVVAELGPSSIRINSVSPGPIVTPMTEMPKFESTLWRL